MDIEFKSFKFSRIISFESFEIADLLNEACKIASFLEYGFMINDKVITYHHLRVFFQKGIIDIMEREDA